MSNLRLLDIQDGVKTGFHKDPMTRRITIANKQDCGLLIDQNKRDQVHGLPDHPELGRLRARVPVVVFHSWLQHDGITTQMWGAMPKKDKARFYRRWLGDPNWRYLNVR